MRGPFVRKCVSLIVACAAPCLTSRAETPLRAIDPGVRPGPASAGTGVAGVYAEYFANTRSAFEQQHSVAGDSESGSGLGPRFNGTSCGGCHAWPAPGGSSPSRNPQLEMATAHAARNAIPDFLKPDGIPRVALALHVAIEQRLVLKLIPPESPGERVLSPNDLTADFEARPSSAFWNSRCTDEA